MKGMWTLKSVKRKSCRPEACENTYNKRAMPSWNPSHILPVSQTEIIFSVTTTLHLHFPKAPLLTNTIISPWNHFYNNNFSILYHLSLSYPLVWFIYRITLVQLYRYGKHTALLNSAWRVSLYLGLFLPLEKVLTFCFLLKLQEKCSENANSQKKTFRGCTNISKN